MEGDIKVPTPTPPPTSLRKDVLGFIAVVLLLAAAAVLAIFLLSGDTPPQPPATPPAPVAWMDPVTPDRDGPTASDAVTTEEIQEIRRLSNGR